MATMKQLGASSMQIIGKLNTIVLLAFSMGFWGERMPQVGRLKQRSVKDAEMITWGTPSFSCDDLRGSPGWNILRACWRGHI